jgi:AcrR family transcriptional regulator
MRLRFLTLAGAFSALALLSFTTAPAGASGIQIGFPTSLKIEEDDGEGLKMRLTEDGRTLKVDAKGTFELNEDETDFTAISPGGHFKVETRRRGRTEHQFEARGLSNGGLERIYRRKGKVMPLDAEGRVWLEQSLAEIVRNTSFAAKGHVARVYARSGAQGVLDEFEEVNGDHSKRIYMQYLMAQPGLDAATLERVARAAGEGIGSDYELTELIIHVVEHHATDENVKLACARATKDIGSDHERRRALFAIVRDGTASPEVAQAVVESAGNIGSDHERTETLVAFADTQPLEGAIVDPFFRAVSELGSDHERQRTLVSVVARHQTPAVRQAAVESTRGMGSDYQRATALMAVADTGPIDSGLAPAYFEATREMGSDHEQGRVLLNALKRGPLPNESLRALIGCAGDIGSDSQQADVLIEVVRSHALDGDLLRLVQDTARDLGSDYQQRRVSDAIADRRL